MDVELIEIREFIAGHPPFDQLPAGALDSLPRHLTVRYLRRGSSFPPQDIETPALFMIRTGAIEFRDQAGNLLEKLGEGDIHVSPCLDVKNSITEHGIVTEDSLLYLLPCENLQALRTQHPAFSSHFEQNLRERLQHAIQQLQQGPGVTSNLMGLDCGALIRRPAVTIEPEQNILAAAKRMTEERVSSLLISKEGILLGIVTDRDLRERCIAGGVDKEQSVSTIMTPSPVTLTQETPAFEALLEMSRHHIHHLPILGNDGTPLGVLNVNDLLHQHSLSTVTLATTIQRSTSVEALIKAAKQLPELQLQLIRSGLTSTHLSQAITTLSDALSKRLLHLAEEELGPPPVPYTWLVCGSQARGEQTSVSDQDNALIIDDAMQPHDDAYFAALAEFVCEGLARCGFSYCPGDVMASNPKWRQPKAVWRRYFEQWIDSPEPMALMHSSIFFDMRPLHGEEKLHETLHRDILQRCRDNHIFLAFMTANALKHRPPLGFFRQFVLVHDGKHDDSLDLKHRGVIPVVDLVRVFALSGGLPQLNTRERLRVAEKAGIVSHEGAEDLQHALEFIATLRARHQAEQHLAGKAMDNYLRPNQLSRLEQAQLKDAFAVISTMQEAMAQRYQSERFV